MSSVFLHIQMSGSTIENMLREENFELMRRISTLRKESETLQQKIKEFESSKLCIFTYVHVVYNQSCLGIDIIQAIYVCMLAV